jgi:hypothetical protein
MTPEGGISDNRGRDLPMQATHTDPAKIRLHVLEMATWFAVGGIPRHVIALATYLRENGHRVSMGGSPGDCVNPENEADLINLPFRYGSYDGGTMAARLVRLAKAVWILRRWLRQNRVDRLCQRDLA